jgi:nitroreductase
MNILEAISQRKSIRAFLAQQIPEKTILEILKISSRAPSGSNTQPWRVYVLQGEKLKKLTEEVSQAYESIQSEPSHAKRFKSWYSYYPEEWVSPYVDRRRENGWGLYSLLGIQKGDKANMHAQFLKNFTFFGAPVGLIFTIDKSLGRGSFLDYGMYLQNIMLAAKEFGLDTCPQAAWNEYEKIILPIIGSGPNELLVCGMALGYMDKSDKVNEYASPREDPSQFITWLS